MRTVFWENNELKLIDQRRLPGALEVVGFRTHVQVAQAIRDMVVRGAPAIGITAAFGMALAAQESRSSSRLEMLAELSAAGVVLIAARPTAANLAWAVKRILEQTEEQTRKLGDVPGFVLAEAQKMADDDVEINRRISQHGSALLESGDTIIHHCNTGALAAVEWGTALGVIRMAHEQGKRIHVLVDETRPRLQGSRLTAWELQQYGIPFEIITDNMAGYFLQHHQVQKVLFGADRVAANGDVANKVGTYMLSLSAADNGVPVYAVVPTSTIDLALADGSLIPIEERDPGEVLEIEFRGESVSPMGARARNPAFDVTPNRLISAIVTENGIAYSPYSRSLPALTEGNQEAKI